MSSKDLETSDSKHLSNPLAVDRYERMGLCPPASSPTAARSPLRLYSREQLPCPAGDSGNSDNPRVVAERSLLMFGGHTQERYTGLSSEDRFPGIGIEDAW